MNKGGFSIKRLSRYSSSKAGISKKTGIPFTKSGRQRKIGKIVTGGGCLTTMVFIVLIILIMFVFLSSVWAFQATYWSWKVF